MNILFTFYIFIIWTLFWSFTSVIIDRIKNKKSWILTGRSECPKCKHTLWAFDLIPIFSFLSTKWKCRYCKEKISFIYPILEIAMGILFIIASYFLLDLNWILTWSGVEIYKLFFYLLFSFLTLVYVFYDILYLEIPDSILALLILISFVTISLQSVFPHFQIINILPSYNDNFSSGIIYFLIIFWIIMISSLYIIMIKWLKEIYDIWILALLIIWIIIIKYYFQIDLENTAIWSALLWSLAIFLFLFLQILVSSGTWMWGWDLRIWILIWLIVGINLSFQSMMVSYLCGSIIGIWIILYWKITQYYQMKKSILNRSKKNNWLKEKKTTLNTQMPFWPFLAIWIFVMLFWWDVITFFVKNYL